MIMLQNNPSECTRKFRNGTVCGSKNLIFEGDEVFCPDCGGVGHPTLVNVNEQGKVVHISYLGARSRVR